MVVRLWFVGALMAGIFQPVCGGEVTVPAWDDLAIHCMTRDEPTLVLSGNAPQQREDGFERARQFLRPTQPVSAECERAFLHFAYGSPEKAALLFSPISSTWVNENDVFSASWWPRDRGLAAASESKRADLHNVYPGVKKDGKFKAATDYKVAEQSTAAADCIACDVAQLKQNISGDMARAALYMGVMYGPTRFKKDVIAIAEKTQKVEGGNRFGPLCQLLAWAIADPVSEEELHRHRVASRIQGNANPFVLDPSLTSDLWQLRCGSWGLTDRN